MQSFRLGEHSFVIDSGHGERAIPYADIALIESVRIWFLGSPVRPLRHILYPADGGAVALQAAYRDRWRLADKRVEFEPFAHALFNRIKAANPDFQWLDRRHWSNRLGGLGGKLGVGLIRFLRRTGPDRWADVAAWVMRRLGPLLGGHRRALEQIALAFPEKSPAEHRRIAVGMWDNLARTIVEYAQLETLAAHDPAHPERSRIIRTDASNATWERIKAANRPTLHFSLHIANWELAAIAGVGYVRCLIPYRALKNTTMTAELVRTRCAAGTTPIPAGPSLISRIRREFGPGDGLGMLIDQRYARGVNVMFFNRPTSLNPLFARLGRIYDCPIYASRVIRRPDHRFDYEIIPVEPTRDAGGRIDVEATTQQFATLMEQWIREHPEQWLWLHRTWR
jgi:KDO2-lipid IV(A) lauroyltransferase